MRLNGNHRVVDGGGVLLWQKEVQERGGCVVSRLVTLPFFALPPHSYPTAQVVECVQGGSEAGRTGWVVRPDQRIFVVAWQAIKATHIALAMNAYALYMARNIICGLVGYGCKRPAFKDSSR